MPMFRTWFNHLSIEGHLGCFQILPIMNKVAMSIHIPVFM